MNETIKQVLDLNSPAYMRWFAILDLEVDAQFEDEKKEIVDCLVQVLEKDPNPIVKHDAAYLLGKLQSVTAVDALCNAAMNDKSPLVRHEAAEILAFLPPNKKIDDALKVCAQDPVEIVRETAQIVIDRLNYQKTLPKKK